MKIKGIILKQALQIENITQEEAAKRLNVSRPTVSVWCNKEILTDDIIGAVKDKLDIDLTSVRYGSRAMVSDKNASTEDLMVLYKSLIEEKDKRIQDKDGLIQAQINSLRDKDEIIELLKDKLAIKSKAG